MDDELLTEVRKKKARFKRFKERRKHGLSVNQAWLEYKFQKLKVKQMQKWKRQGHIHNELKEAGRSSMD